MTGSDPQRAQAFLQQVQARVAAGYYRVIIIDRDKELLDLGLTPASIPYTVEPVPYPAKPARFVVNGYTPRHWLAYRAPGS